jgi:hypothetical protein
VSRRAAEAAPESQEPNPARPLLQGKPRSYAPPRSGSACRETRSITRQYERALLTGWGSIKQIRPQPGAGRAMRKPSTRNLSRTSHILSWKRG